MAAIDEPIRIGRVEVPNRLYRAPLLECAGNGPDAVDRLIDALEPAAEAGAGLLFQGATIVSPEGGCAAPGMTRVHDPSFVAELERLTEAVGRHGSRLFLQLEHGGLRSMETWHAGYRDRNPELRQLAPSRPPRLLRALDALGLLSYDVDVLSTGEVYELAAAFGRAAARAADAGYDGIHLAGANMGIVQQFLSPYYNRRDDEFGGTLADRTRFLAAIHDEIRERAGRIPLATKVPAEVAAPRFVRRRLSRDDAVETARRLAGIGFDAVVPVETSVFWDMSIVRGEYPARAWRESAFADGYAAAFGGPLRARLVAAANRIESLTYDREPRWNAALCRQVADAVDVPVLCEGGVRTRSGVDALLADGIDMAGMGRPFYAEPRLPARLLNDRNARVACESCNNCTVPQVTGADGRCRTPSVLRRRGEFAERGAYDRSAAGGSGPDGGNSAAGDDGSGT